MLIRVMYLDGRYDMVKRWTLERLIEQRRIKAFYRSGSWSRIGRDPLRASQSSDYRGQDRREAVELPSGATRH